MDATQKKLLRAWILLTSTTAGADRGQSAGQAANDLGILADDPLRGRFEDLIQWSRTTEQEGAPASLAEYFGALAERFKAAFNSGEGDPWPDTSGPEHPRLAELTEGFDL